MTATAITWRELITEAQTYGRLPVVIPTGSYPLVGYFDPLPKYEIPFALACFSPYAQDRVRAMVAAAMWTRSAYGLEL